MWIGSVQGIADFLNFLQRPPFYVLAHSPVTFVVLLALEGARMWAICHLRVSFIGHRDRSTTSPPPQPPPVDDTVFAASEDKVCSRCSLPASREALQVPIEAVRALELAIPVTRQVFLVVCGSMRFDDALRISPRGNREKPKLTGNSKGPAARCLKQRVPLDSMHGPARHQTHT